MRVYLGFCHAFDFVVGRLLVITYYYNGVSPACNLRTFIETKKLTNSGSLIVDWRNKPMLCRVLSWAVGSTLLAMLPLYSYNNLYRSNIMIIFVL